MSYREIDPSVEVERLRRRVRALERAHRMTSPLRGFARFAGRLSAALRRDPGVLFWPIFVLVALFAGGGLMSTCRSSTRRMDRCALACAREGLALRSTAGEGCICEPSAERLRAVSP